MQWIARALALAAVLWVISLPVAVFAAHQPSGSPANLFAFAVYTLGSVICHQRPERSFHLWSAQLPVCARCTGIYIGAAVGALAAMGPTGVGRPAAAGRRPGLTAQTARLALTIAVVPAVLTLLYEWTTGTAPSNMIRALSGVVLGATAAWVVVRQT